MENLKIKDDCGSKNASGQIMPIEKLKPLQRSSQMITSIRCTISFPCYIYIYNTWFVHGGQAACLQFTTFYHVSNHNIFTSWHTSVPLLPPPRQNSVTNSERWRRLEVSRCKLEARCYRWAVVTGSRVTGPLSDDVHLDKCFRPRMNWDFWICLMISVHQVTTQNWPKLTPMFKASQTFKVRSVETGWKLDIVMI